MDVHEFMNNHRAGYKVVENKIEQFEYYDLDRSYVNMISENRFSLVVKSRQMHFTDTMAAYTAWHLLFNTDEDTNTVVYVSVNLSLGKNFRERVKNLLIQYGLTKNDLINDNQNTLTLVNGNTLRIFPSTPDAFCSYSINGLLIMDEVAFIKRFKELYSIIVPTISNKCRVIIASTPNGIDFFHRLYDYAMTGKNLFKVLFVNYKDNPKFNNDNWFNQMCKDLGDPKRIKVELLGEFISGLEYETLKKPKDKQIIFRVNDEVMSKIGEKLIELDVSISDYIRGLINKDLNQ